MSWESSGCGMGGAIGRHGRAHLDRNRLGDERARRDGDDSGHSRAASRAYPRTHVCGAGGHGSGDVTHFRAGDPDDNQTEKSVSLKEIVSSELFLINLTSDTKNGVLREMCDVAAPLVGNAPERFFRLVSERERVTSGGWRFGVAVPYARVDGLSRPMVTIGRTEKGIDFDSRDGRPAKLIVLILTPDNRSQHDLLADAGQLFSPERNGGPHARRE
jgi:mannitol/fructose-specific phosphotransferase system IIA component (Ntr-type)